VPEHSVCSGTENLRKHSPDVIILNWGHAQVIGLGSIIMNEENISKVYQAAPETIIVASQMEAVTYATRSRKIARVPRRQGHDVARAGACGWWNRWLMEGPQPER
jgi:hypothetical protein